MKRPIEDFTIKMIGQEAWDHFKKNFPDKEKLNQAIEHPESMSNDMVKEFVKLIDHEDVDEITFYYNFVKRSHQNDLSIYKHETDFIKMVLDHQIQNIEAVSGFFKGRNSLTINDSKVLKMFIEDFINHINTLENLNADEKQKLIDTGNSIIHKINQA